VTNKAILPPRGDGFARKKWNVAECRFLTDSGLLEPGKYELIEGEIVFKMGRGRLHIIAISHILTVLAAIFGLASLQNQAQIGIGERDEFNDPEPDIAVLRGRVDDYRERDPDPATEVLLLVEAANSSLKGDTTVKANIYARHGLPEYWVVAIPTRQLIVHRQPTTQGYADVQTYAETDAITPLAAPSSSVRVADLLP
jgi:Uma2 family endonuclease